MARGVPLQPLPRCEVHLHSPASTCSCCVACCALRGTTPSQRGKGTSGAERARRRKELDEARTTEQP